MNHNLPAFLSESENHYGSCPKKNRRNLSFLDNTLRAVGNTIKRFYLHSESGNVSSFLSGIHPGIKMLALIILIVSISLANTITAQLVSLLIIVIMFLISQIKLRYLYKKILVLSFLFGFLIFAPAMLNVVSPGNIVIEIFSFNNPYQFWIYTIPKKIGITDNGIALVAVLFLRVFNSISLSLIFVYSTSFSKLTQGLKILFIPDMFIMVISLTYKFIIILAKGIEDTYLALRSRLFGKINSGKIRSVVSGRVLFIFKKAKSNYENTYDAMTSRGYTGKVVLSNKNKAGWPDAIFLFFVIAAGTLIILI